MIKLSVSIVEAVSALEKHLMLKAGLLVLAEIERNVQCSEKFQDSH